MPVSSAGLKILSASEVIERLQALRTKQPVKYVAFYSSQLGGIVDPRLDSLKRQIIDECLDVARADGVSFDEDFVALIDRVFAGARTIASMRQDLMKGRKTEIDHMNGAVAELGRRYGLGCPVNAALTTMIRYLEAGS